MCRYISCFADKINIFCLNSNYINLTKNAVILFEKT